MKLTQLKRKLAYLNTLLDSAPQSRLTKSEIYGLLLDIYRLELQIERLEPVNELHISPLNSGSRQFYWVEFSPRVAQIRSEQFSAITYVHFDSQLAADSFCSWLSNNYRLNCQSRKASRFPSGWECKIRNIPPALLSQLIAKDNQRPLPYQLSTHCNSKKLDWLEFYSPTGTIQKMEPIRTIKLGRYRRTMWELSQVGYYHDSQGRYFYVATNPSGQLELHYCDEFGVA